VDDGLIRFSLIEGEGYNQEHATNNAIIQSNYATSTETRAAGRGGGSLRVGEEWTGQIRVVDGARTLYSLCVQVFFLSSKMLASLF